MVSLPLFEGHAWDWNACDAEPIRVTRGARIVGPHAGGYDAKTDQLYLDACADVRAGDVVHLRGVARRVVDVPEVWRGAGVVVQLAPEAAFLDAGQILRLGTASGAWDYTLGAYVPAVDVVVWSGPCTITAVEQGVDGTEVAEEMVTVQTFTVEAPVGLVDVRPDDVVLVTSSVDQRLVGRRLVVTRVQAGSAGVSRVFRAIDNQG